MYIQTGATLVLVLLLTLGCSGSESESAAEDGGGGSATEMAIEVLVEGSGRSPKASDTVSVHYHGTFPDGRVFDSSVDRGKPAVFPLNGVIPCWTQGLQTMKEGGKIRLTCPPDLAYGPSGKGSIPPNATLIFEVELLKIH